MGTGGGFDLAVAVAEEGCLVRHFGQGLVRMEAVRDMVIEEQIPFRLLGSKMVVVHRRSELVQEHYLEQAWDCAQEQGPLCPRKL